MKVGVAILIFFGLVAFGMAQENRSTEQTVSPSIGLQVEQSVPSFILTDQFGHDQSNQTLRGTHGTVLLFFRSADW